MENLANLFRSTVLDVEIVCCHDEIKQSVLVDIHNVVFVPSFEIISIILLLYVVVAVLKNLTIDEL